jgi:hypothetical protein
VQKTIVSKRLDLARSRAAEMRRELLVITASLAKSNARAIARTLVKKASVAPAAIAIVAPEDFKARVQRERELAVTSSRSALIISSM